MIDRELLDAQLSELPLYIYTYIDPEKLEFSPRIRWICQNECPMYGQTWACPPGVGEVCQCEQKIRSYRHCLMVGTITEVEDIIDIEAGLATRGPHEEVTNQVRDLLRAQGVDPYILSTEACAVCERCAILDGQPCRFPQRMHPCVESQGIIISDLAEKHGIPFLYGGNIVTWFSLILYND